MSRNGHCPNLYQDRNRHCHHDYIGSHTRHTHPQDDAHDHNHEAAQVELVFTDHFENQISYRKSQAGQGNRTDYHSDHHTGYSDTDSASGALHRCIHDILKAHPRFLAEPGGQYSGKYGEYRSIERCIPQYNHSNQDYQRNY